MSDETKIKFKEELSRIESGTTIQFIVSNGGKIPQEFSIGNAAEPKEHEEMKHNIPGMTNADDNTVTIELGKAKTLTWLFAGSDAVDLSCNIPGHCEAGMFQKVKLS